MAEIKLTKDNKKKLVDAVKQYWVDKVASELKSKWVTTTGWNLVTKDKTDSATPSSVTTSFDSSTINKPENIKPVSEGAAFDTGDWEIEDGTTLTEDKYNKEQADKQAEIDKSKSDAEKAAEDLKWTIEQQSSSLAGNKETDLANLEADKKEDTSSAEALASEQERLLKEQEAENKRREQEILAEQEKNKALELKKLDFEQEQAKKQAERDREALQAERDLNIEKNKQAIIDAETATESARFQSAHNFRKLWLAFSSASLETAQTIANEWIQKIAQIKAKMNYDERNFGIKEKEINEKYAEVVQEYTFKHSDIVNTYDSKAKEVKSEYIKQYNQINSNLRLNNLQKKEAIDKINKEYRDWKSKLERQFLADTITLKKETLEATERIEKIKTDKENSAKSKISAALSSWAWYLKTPLEQKALLAQAGLTSVDWKAIEEKTIWDWIVSKVTSIMPEEYTLDFVTKNKIREATSEYIKSGYSPDVAIDRAASEILKDTDEYKRFQKLKDLSLKEKEAKLLKSLKGGSGGWSSTNKVQLVPWTGWRYYYFDPVGQTLKEAKDIDTWESVIATWKTDPNEDPFTKLLNEGNIWNNTTSTTNTNTKTETKEEGGWFAEWAATILSKFFD